jgi:hypothetical protein
LLGLAHNCSQLLTRRKDGVADWRYEFLRGGGAATQKFIPGLSNAVRIRKMKTGDSQALTDELMGVDG